MALLDDYVVLLLFIYGEGINLYIIIVLCFLMGQDYKRKIINIDDEEKEKDSKAIDDLVLQTARIEVVKIVRDNIMATEQYWKFRKNMLLAGGIKIESNIQLLDFGDLFELRITCRIPEESAKLYAERRLLFKHLYRLIEQKGQEYIRELFACKQPLTFFHKDDWGVDVNNG